MNFAGGLNYGRYVTAGLQEWMIRIGSPEGTPILFIPPLLEEMNRTRAFIVTVMRLLARQGFGCWLPDLPGTGESEQALAECSLAVWRQAVLDGADQVAETSGRRPVLASVRGGALLDGGSGPLWRFAPVEGASLTRDLVRAAMAKPEELKSARIHLAGYELSDLLFSDLQEAKLLEAKTLRTVRLASDRGEADHKVEGPALWRRSEPANSSEMAELLAADLTEWCNICAAS